MSSPIHSEMPQTRKVQVLLTIEYEGGTQEDLAETMRHAMNASISVNNLLQGCDNIDAKVVDYTHSIDELAELPALSQENPSESGNDFVMNEGQPSVWIKVDDHVVYIRRAVDDMLLVDVFKSGEEDGDPVDSIAIPGNSLSI